MTDDIDALLPPDLNAAVAVEVMGWIASPDLTSSLDGSPVLHAGGGRFVALRDWHPSADPAACAEVERELWRRGMEQRTEMVYWRTEAGGDIYAVKFSISGPSGRAESTVVIPPDGDFVAARCLATCRAGLRWMRAGKEQEQPR